MNIKVFQNRKIEKDYFYNEGTQNENSITVLTFEVPLGYEDFSKRIVFITEDGNFWDYIPENEYEIKNNISKYEKVEAYLWLTKDEQDFRSKTFELNFYENENADNLVPTEEQLDGFATILDVLELKIDEVEALKVEIGDFQKALNSKASKEELKEVDNKFNDYYPKTETYNKTEIDNKISVIPKFNRIVVDELPTENIQEDAIYLVPSQGDTNDLYREYIYIDSKWELIGIQKGDLSNIYTKQEVDEMVREIQETNEYQSEIIDQFKNEFKQITVSGDSIYISDAAELPMELIPYGEPVQEVIEEELGTTVEGESVVVSDGDPNKEVKDVIPGNSYQYTTEGYQAINNVAVSTSRNGIDYTVNKDGSVTINGTATATSFLVLTNSFNGINSYTEEIFTIQEKYYLNPINTKYSKIKYGFRTTDGNYIVDTSPLAGISVGLVYLEIPTGINIENETVYPMLINGSSEAKPYEPYTNGASPNTEYEQPIEVIDGVNRFDFEKLKELDNTITGTADNFTITTRDKTIIYNDLPTEQLTIKGKWSTTYGNGNLKVFYTDDTNTEIFSKYDNSNVSDTEFNFKTDSSKTVDYIRFVSYGTKSNFTFKEFMVYEGTEEKPYLPYGHIGLVHRGKNYLDYDLPVENYFYNASGEKVEDTQTYINQKIYIGKGEKIYFSCKSNTSATLRLCEYDKNGKFIKRTLVNASMAITLDNNTNYIIVSINKSDNSYFEEPQIELGEQPTTYEKGHYELIPINLNGNSIAKVSSVDDKLKIYVNGNVELEKKTLKYRFSGLERLLKSSTYIGSYYIDNSVHGINIKNNGRVLCNRLREVTDIANYKVGSIILYNNASINIWLDDGSEISTIEKLKEYLQNNETYILAEAYTPEVIDLPSIEPITLFNGTNVFELVTNLGTTMALTYNYVTPSPSIDRPSEILTVKGSYDTEKVNKNLNPNSGVDYVSTNSKKFFLPKGSYIAYLNDKSKFSSAMLYMILYDKVSQAKITEAGHLTNFNFSTTSYNYYLGGDTRELKFETDDDYYVTLGFNAQLPLTGTELMLEREMIAKGYTPHQSSTLPLTLSKELLGEIVTLSEEEATNLGLDGAGKYRRTDKAKDTLKSNYNWLRTSTNNGNYYFFTNYFANKIKKVNQSLEVANIMSDKFNAVATNSTGVYGGNEGIGVNPNGQLSIYSDDTKQMTADEFMVWLDNQLINICYELATSTYEKITDETELLQLSAYDKQVAFYGINNINTYPTDDLVKAPLGIHATYSKSNKLTIQSLEERLASLESQVTNLQDNQI